jgi:dihydropteroate synthase
MPWPRIMGILNVTPDSFSDGGRFADPEAAVAAGLALHEAGADIVDIGGESTRPGAEPVTQGEEADRVVPVIEALARAGCTVSVDTRHAAVMQAALAAGATMINDVTALTGDPGALGFAASCAVPVVLMHMQGEPRTMQADPSYTDVSLDVFDELQAYLRGCETAGIAPQRLIVDPGIGFGKTLAHNLTLLADLTLLHGLGRPVLLGASRKSFIGRLDGGRPADARLAGSLAVAQAAADHGAAILRVHDVAETRQMLRLRAALAGTADGD